MDTILALSTMLAATCGVLAGLASIVGLQHARDRLLRVAAGLFAAGLVLSSLLGTAVRLTAGAGGALSEAAPIAVLALIGHVALAAALAKRRIQGPERARAHRAELAAARGRERVRIPAEREEAGE